jgi:peptidoglycan/LPS O-acetylase OafA/YrhL
LYKSLQGCRAIAALAVLLYHLARALAADQYYGRIELFPPLAFGHAGVEFFFVLSGFIILSAHWNDVGQPGQLPSYLRKRFVRIYPSYWVIFFAVFLAATLSSTLYDKVPHDTAVLIRAFLLIPQSEWTTGAIGSPVLAVAWTLEYEVFFYLIFAALIIGKRTALLCASVITIIYCSKYTALAPVTLPGLWLAQDWMVLFALGMIVAAVHRSSKIAMKRPQWWVALGVVLFTLIAAFEIAGNSLARQSILYGIASGVIILGLVRTEDAGCALLGHHCFQQAGDASYVLYLIHFPVISFVLKSFIHVGIAELNLSTALIVCVFITVICVTASILFHTKIEVPILALLRQRRVQSLVAAKAHP